MQTIRANTTAIVTTREVSQARRRRTTACKETSMSVNSELAALNSLGNMSLEGSIADRGVNTGVLSSGHGVSFDGDATNSLGRISDAGSVPYADKSNYDEPT